MLLKKLVIVGLAASLLAGCASDGSNQNATLGTLAGAVGGAALGSAFGSGSGKVAAIAGGALIGGFLGNQIGASLDRESQQYNYNASVQALDTGAPQQWQNPQNGVYGTVAPGPVIYSNDRYCRPYTNTVFIDGQQQVARGTACRNPDGSWQVIS